MKRLFGIVLVLCLVLTVLPLLSAAEEVTSDTQDTSITWSFDQATGTLTISGNGKIDSSLYEQGSFPWFSFRQDIRSIIIGDGVTYIADYAFGNYTSLTHVSIADSVTEIGTGAFRNCTSLTSISLSGNLTQISSKMFQNCSALTDVVIPEGVSSISDSAFRGCTNLRSVALPHSLEKINTHAFADCSALTGITFPEKLRSISDQAFLNCVGLKKIVFKGDAPMAQPASFEGVTANAFFYKNNDTWYDYNAIPGSINFVWTASDNPEQEEVDFFSGTCGRDTRWKLADGVLTISGSGPMEYIPWKMHKEDIKTVIIESGVTRIYHKAFYGCVNLTAATIPEGVTSIDPSAFYNCTSLASITIPDGAKSIGSMAFANCKKLKNVSITDDVTTIGYRAFENCTSLSYLVLPDSLEKIDDRTFWCCSELVGIEIPKSVKSIGESAFNSCSKLHTVTIPERVTFIGDYAFAFCSSMAEIYFRGNAPKMHTFTLNKVKATACYPVNNPTWTESVRNQCFNCTILWVPYYVGDVDLGDEPEGETVTLVTVDPAELGEETQVWINGVAYPVEKDGDQFSIHLPEEAAVKVGSSMVSYSYNVGDANDIHTQYPTGMRVWIVKQNSEGNYYAKRVTLLDNLLQYSGSSIRISGNKGIRMITSITKSNKKAMTSKGLAGYKLVEYGTALCWAKDLEGGKPMTLGQSYVKSNYAYKFGVADPVFATTDDLVQYTNVLVGFTLDQCKDDIAMRPYIILTDANGYQITIYGGIVYRSIGYIAYQNRAVFKPDSSSYDYVWDIIHHVYGDQYDADYKG